MDRTPTLRYDALTGALDVTLLAARDTNTLHITDEFYVRRIGKTVVGVVINHLADFDDYGLLELHAGQAVARVVADAQRQHGA